MTTVEASGALSLLFSGAYYEWAELKPPSCESQLLIADNNGNRIRRIVRVDEAPQVKTWQQNLHRINELLLSRCIYLDAPNDLILDAGVRSSISAAGTGGGHLGAFSFSQVTLRRIFARGRLDHGGRFYGGWWQRIPGKYRRHLAIDGSLTCEADYSGMALNCLYAAEGKDLGREDPYDIGLDFTGNDDPRRKTVKRYLNAVLNDEKGTYRLPPEEQRSLKMNRKELHDRVAKRHASVAHHFHTGVGLRLQFMESEIAERVMLRFADQGEVCLPIHDSFIVRHELIDQLVHVMQEEFRSTFGRGITVKPEEVLLGERIAAPDPANVPRGLTPDEQSGALHAIHWGRLSIASRYHSSWVMANKTQAEIDGAYLQAIETWKQIRPRIQELTCDVHFP